MTFLPFVSYFGARPAIHPLPDLPGCLPSAHTTEEAFKNAREALGLHLFGLEQDGDVIPEPTPVNKLIVEPNAVVTMIEVFMPAIRDRINNGYVKKTLTIPAWLNRAAEEADVNFSQLLQESLKNYLGDGVQLFLYLSGKVFWQYITVKERRYFWRSFIHYCVTDMSPAYRT